MQIIVTRDEGKRIGAMVVAKPAANLAPVYLEPRLAEDFIPDLVVLLTEIDKRERPSPIAAGV